MATKFFLCFAFLLWLSNNANVEGQGQVPLRLSVYYETLCPDSIRFITRQFFSNYLLLGGFGNPYLDIDFVPYGKAQTYDNGEGYYNFTCQHGPRECEGNKVHACALQYLPEKRRTEFVYCSMNSTNPPEAGPACAEKLNLDFSSVQNCLTTDGPSLLAYNGLRTHALVPTLYYVPWIVYNSVFDEIDLADSQTKFLALVCQKLREGGHELAPACHLH